VPPLLQSLPQGDYATILNLVAGTCVVLGMLAGVVYSAFRGAIRVGHLRLALKRDKHATDGFLRRDPYDAEFVSRRLPEPSPRALEESAEHGERPEDPSPVEQPVLAER
jgi:hypothetical protein